MGIRVYKPRTPGRRGMTAVTTEELSKKRPEKSLTSFRRSTGARNNEGRTTVRFRGGGHKRLYRKIDFRRDKTGFQGPLPRLNTIPIGRPELRWCTIRMGKSAIFWPRLA